ncbi:pyruvate dehydrogenase complex dihydrolipoamide acetyltransferase [Methylocella tundrae]|uniref:Acetyltransferase component of pyruvate dehydrogenase complex n=1 Tax=Methylocella tundrae TaxID=227605 RepID=A0A4U8YYS3_METTU|nr:pyruvate dehydrogenase complex dihydrolipoamide acetyltransferase [Methylocella tundrae]WPP05562.1 pyruvate dehydrogenase complex dihydrolipoamide acetyltransferase [Methylocella tundrae]VFU08004.1 Dihydrolipoyllysine-residue acetyltransferase component of pyruvate dehydrogenase complex [Methylocella tundrae]
MPINILMPALSPTMEKGNLSRWLKKEGDTVKSGDILAEIETDKATMEVEAVDEGVLAKIVVPDGTPDVAVNDVIGVIAGDGEDAASAAPAAAPKAAPTTTVSAPAPATVAPAAPAAAPLGSSVNGHAGPRIFASPLARRIAKTEGLDLSAIAGSGPHGRVIERDVKAALTQPRLQTAKAPVAPAPTTPAPTPASDDAIRKLFQPGSYDETPHDSMRKTIARRLVEASQTIPHFYLSVDCDLDALLAVRESVNASAPRDKDGKPAYKISVNDFIIKALALALIRVPDANVTWTEAAMLKHKHADVGVAVSIPGGLITPVIRSADTKSLSTISNEMKDFAARAKARKLKPEEYQGGSSSVSNLGMMGIKSFSAIINPPQASILAVGAGEQRVIVKDGAPVVATLMSATLSTDHRAIDGALGAELIGAFKHLIERPMGMLV